MRIIIFSFLALASFQVVSAQKDFSGTWKFKSQQSVDGNLYNNGSPVQIKITQDNQKIVIEKQNDNGQGVISTTADTVTADGKPIEVVTKSKRKKVITLSWAGDKNSFTEAVNIYSLTDPGKVDYKVIDIYSLNSNSTALSLDRKDENNTNGEVWESIATYSK
jgi:hypothetical protein